MMTRKTNKHKSLLSRDGYSRVIVWWTRIVLGSSSHHSSTSRRALVVLCIMLYLGRLR